MSLHIIRKCSQCDTPFEWWDFYKVQIEGFGIPLSKNSYQGLDFCSTKCLRQHLDAEEIEEAKKTTIGDWYTRE